jgi:aryl-alcohol dehydrogenase-like predicted oxidoreductase
MPLEHRPYGRSGIYVPALAFGSGRIGGMARAEAFRLLDTAHDLGIVLIDTAPSYGDAEATLGAWIAERRRHPVLSTKLGYGVPGVPDWTPECLRHGIDLALQRLHVDCLDIVHLHSCPAEVLQRDELIEVLRVARQTGKVRAIAYSGENAALRQAAGDLRFDGLMASFNLCDQKVADEIITPIGVRGFLAKRPLANAPWRFAEQPHGDYAEAYWLRWRSLALPETDMPWGELALRFAAWQPGICSAVLGTARVDNLRQAAAWVARGPLPSDLQAALRQRFRACDPGWEGQI